MSAFRSGIFTTGLADRIGFGVTLNADGSILTEDGPTLERVTVAPTATRNAGSLALRTNGTLYATTGAGVWFALGGASGWNLPDDVSGTWGTAAPGQVTSTYVSASNRWDLSGDAISQATAASGAAIRIETGNNTITGAVVGNASALIEMRTGATDVTDAGGTGGNSGALSFSTGNAASTAGAASGSTGAISLVTGNSTDNNSGDINLTVGTATVLRGSIVCSALSVRALDTVPFAVGTLANDRFSYQYNLGTTTGEVVGTAITAGGATQATRPFRIVTGARTTNDAVAGQVSGALTFATGATVQSGAAIGGASGAIAITSGATTQQTANAGGISGAVTIGSGATDVTLAAGTGGNSGVATFGSGNTDISAAVAATGGASGAAFFQTGNALSTGATATSGASGVLTVRTGTSDDANTGNIAISSGNAAAVGAGILSGNIALTTGTVGGTGTTGTISFTTGNPAGAGVSGPIQLVTGTTTGAANTGLISFATGGTGTGATGAITLSTGNATGAGTSGSISLIPGTTVAGTRGQVTVMGLRTSQNTAVAVTGATVLTLADSGGIFNIDQDAAFDIDLPSPTTGAGLRFTFVVGDAGANTVTITVVGGAATFIGNIVNDVTSVISIAGTETSINIINATAALGDTVEVQSISTTLYLVRAVTSTAGGITAT